MNEPIILDEEFCKRLPLPLAQLYRRAHTAKSEIERHHVAYYLWEASLKLLASVVVLEFAAQQGEQTEHDALLQSLAKPETTHWCQILRELLPQTVHADASLHRSNELLTSRVQDELPRCAALDVALLEAASNSSTKSRSDTLLDLFDRLADYHDSVFCADLFPARSAAFYGRMSRALLQATNEWLLRIDVLADQHLLFVSDVSADAGGRWIVQRHTLTGDIARRIRPLELSKSAQDLPRVGQVYLDGALNTTRISDTGSLEAMKSMHPLVLFDVGLDQIFFLNGRADGDTTEYLCYSTGQVLDPKPLAGDLTDLLERLLRRSVDSAAVADWAKRCERKVSAGTPFTARSRGEHTTGEFDLLTRMGQGGMGIVYRAWQPSLSRQVAVKSLLRTGDSKAQARFSREIHALARVDHPNLIKILSSGVEEDRWYYAMELVDGVDLGRMSERLQSKKCKVATLGYRDWLQEMGLAIEESRRNETPLNDEFDVSELLHQPSDDSQSDRSRPYIRHIVELMLQVTDATVALHEAGVVHRDIKPGNMMLTPDGQHAVLMDLGLAQMEDDQSKNVTKTRQFVGTLRYASPEQILSASSVDQRSDVYSLGASLWELLTLNPLFGMHDDSTTLELMQRIEYSDPESIRSYNPAASKDLDAIVSKCLEKRPENRYQSAAELREDLTRYLHHEPVCARPLGQVARAMRTIRRHPMASGLVFACISAIVAMVFLAVNIWTLRTERQFTMQLQTANQRADQSFRQAVKALDDIFALVTEGDLRKRPDLQPLRNQLLAYYQNYIQQFGNSQELDDEMAMELAGVFRRMATITKGVGNKEDALRHYDSAIRPYKELLTRSSADSNLIDTLSLTWIDRGVLLQETRQYEKAERDFTKARDALAELCETDSQNLEFRRHLAEAYHNLGILYEDENRYEQSLASYERGRQIREGLVSESDEREFKRDLGRSYGYLGDVQIALGEYQKALRSYRRSVEIRQQVADSKPSDHEARFQLARGFRNLGHLSRLENDLEMAIKWYTKATDEDRRLVDEEPLISDYRSDLGRYSNDLGELLIDHGHASGDPECFVQSRKHLDEALEMNQEATSRNPNDMLAVSALARTHVNIARLTIQEDQAHARQQIEKGLQHFGRLTSNSAEDLYQQAVVEALSAQLIEMDSTPLTSAQKRQREKHLNKSISLLSQAVIKSRYTVLPRLSRDTAFKELRTRTEFQLVSTIGFQGLRDEGRAYRGDDRLAPVNRTRFAHLSVLAIGVSNYKDPTYSLQFPDDDAEDLSEVLREQLSFETVSIKTLTNDKADRISILNALKQLRLKALDPSLLVVALSGHGKLHESGDYYFLPYDFDFDPDASIAATGISWDDLLREFKEVPGSVIVMIDTCHSGATTNIALRGPGTDAMKVSVRQVTEKISSSDGRGIAVLASSLSAQAAQERVSWGHGALTLAILEAIGQQHIYQENAVSPLPIPGFNQTLSLEQIRAYAVERVNEITDGQQKVIVQSNMSLLDIPFDVASPLTIDPGG